MEEDRIQEITDKLKSELAEIEGVKPEETIAKEKAVTATAIAVTAVVVGSVLFLKSRTEFTFGIILKSVISSSIVFSPLILLAFTRVYKVIENSRRK